jgi:hypothetical protein
MRRIVLVALGIALFAASGTAATRSARVRLADQSPVTVRGAGFVAHERVRVTVSAKTTRTHTVDANAAGAFTTRFLRWTIGGCTAYSISAKGSDGSRAFWRVAPMCAPQLGPTSTEPPLYPTDPTPRRP